MKQQSSANGLITSEAHSIHATLFAQAARAEPSHGAEVLIQYVETIQAASKAKVKHAFDIALVNIGQALRGKPMHAVPQSAADHNPKMTPLFRSIELAQTQLGLRLNG